MARAETLPQCVERAGPDVPVNDAQGTNGESRQISAGSRAGFHSLFLASGQDSLKMRRLFLAGNDTDFYLLEPGRFKPPMQIALRKTKPAVAIQLVRLFKLMLCQVQNHDLAPRLEQAMRAGNRPGRIRSMVQRLAEDHEVHTGRLD